MGIARERYRNLPDRPGVYVFHDARGDVLYVGKAKRLKQRVASYFRNGTLLDAAKQLMVAAIATIDFTVTRTETEALLLEATFIKKHHPPYNVILRDDKNYLYIAIPLAEEYPTVEAVRRIGSRSTRYFGPFTSSAAVHATLRLLKRLFRYRTCTPRQGKPCLDVHLGRCLGPCANAITPEDYRKRVVTPILHFLSGKTREVTSFLRGEMDKAARERRYEQAAEYRDRLLDVGRITSRQTMVSTRRERYDAVSLARDRDWASVNLFAVRDGRVLHRQHFLLEQPPATSDADVLRGFLEQYYALVTDRVPRVLCNIRLPKAAPLERLLGLSIVKPERGSKRKLVELGEENARLHLERTYEEWLADRNRSRLALEQLTTALKLPKLPERIEAFDISNIQGRHAVGSMVVFENAQPKKADYRKFTIRTRHTPDDFAMMAEMLVRRLKQTWPRPSLILLDGGKGQLSSVLDATAGLRGDLPIAALAKREEELFVPGVPKPILLPRGSEELFLIERIRDEAHRFAITFFRGKHRKATVQSALDDIPGIGPKTKRKLLKRFGSLAGIRSASDNELAKVVGQAKTRGLREKLKVKS